MGRLGRYFSGKWPRTPLGALMMAMVVSTGAFSVATWWAMDQPWLGIETLPAADGAGLRVKVVQPDGPAAGILAAGDVISGLGQGRRVVFLFDHHDHHADPDFLPTFKQLDIFFSRQERYFSALTAPVTLFRLADGRDVKVQTRAGRPWHALPWEFWVIGAFGMLAFLIGMWILGGARDRRPALFVLGSGVGFLLMSLSIAVFATREIALPQDELRILLAANHLGGSLFGACYVALLWHYPRRLRSEFLLYMLLFLLVLLWFNEQFRWMSFPGENSLFRIGTLLSFGAALLCVQWWLSRDHPVHHAIMKWLLLSFILGIIGPVGLYYLVGWEHNEPLFLLVMTLAAVSGAYLGMIFGVVHYRLFDVSRWWIYIWVWLAAAIAILGLDMLITMWMPRLSEYSLVMALVFIAWLYFPLRQWLWERVFPSPVSTFPDQLPRFMLGMIAGRREPLEKEWRGLLQDMFHPLHMQTCSYRGGEVELLSFGERLYVPGIRQWGFELCLADHGQRLFTPRDVRFATAVSRAIRSLDEELSEYRRGVVEERDRIMRDLHEDVGGRLQGLIEQCHDRKAGVIAQEALDTLREVIYFSMDADGHMELADVVGRWRSQFKDRLDQHGVTLAWAWDGDAMMSCAMPAMDILNIGRILQEAVSNALKHAEPDTIGVHGRIESDTLRVTIVNDGVGQGMAKARPSGFGGRGLANMKRRAEELRGSLSITSGRGIYEVELLVKVPGVEGGGNA